MLEREIYQYAVKHSDFEVGYRLAEKDLHDILWIFRLAHTFTEIEFKYQQLYKEMDCDYKKGQVLAYRAFLVRHRRLEPDKEEYRILGLTGS